MVDLRVVKRTGEVVDFDAHRIRVAIGKAVSAVGGDVMETTLDGIVEAVTGELSQRFVEFYPNVENIQDIVEKHLVRAQLYEIAKAYILYRAERQKERAAAQEQAVQNAQMGRLTVTKRDGRLQLLNVKKIDAAVRRAARGLASEIDVDAVVREAVKNVFDQVETSSIDKALVLSAASFIEREPAHGFVAGRLLLQRLYKEVMGSSLGNGELDDAYRAIFTASIAKNVERGHLDQRLLDFDLDRLAAALRPERDLLFRFLGIQTLSERYFLRDGEAVAELPQTFWMRVAMGLAVEEEQRDD